MLSISPKVQKLVPKLCLHEFTAEVRIGTSPPALLAEIDEQCKQIAFSMTNEKVAAKPAIHAAREAYRAFGKDPARYRPSAEALLRRVVSGKGLYQVNNAVDLLNLVSITTGFSIGGYDADAVQGDILLDVGRADDVYEGIGRGLLNVEGLPLLRDAVGPFGSPTSDSVRTCVKAETTRFRWVFFAFGGEAGLAEASELAQRLLRDYGSV
jgi:DNA/RNA-binding domain of Phe-tRNA-synthetase-like protein